MWGLCYNPRGDNLGRCEIIVLFRGHKFQLSCEDPKACAKKFGQMADTLQRRLAQLRAAEVLGDIAIGKPHPLAGHRSGQFAVTLSQNYRLIFEPADDPLPIGEDGLIDPTRVLSIRILEVVDYHD